MITKFILTPPEYTTSAQQRPALKMQCKGESHPNFQTAHFRNAK
jgi:hypothetical protein